MHLKDGALGLLPEQVHYRDTGCRKHPRCLTCPLLVCVLDLPPEPTVREQTDRDARIITYRQQGLTIVQVMIKMGVSKSTVIRAMRATAPTSP